MTLEEIKDTYSMMDILNRLNIKVNRGFINCPLHSGDRTASLKVYPKSFYCFGCGKGGDIINFVEEYFGSNFTEACEWISGENLNKMGKRALVVARIKKKAKEEKQDKIKKQLSEMQIGPLWQAYLMAEPFSDTWTEAYNNWQLQVYKQETLMNELG